MDDKILSTSQPHNQFKALDGLRGFAALVVVLSHTSNADFFFAPFLDFSGTGKAGVYLFFVLSSFLLTLPLLKLGNEIFSGYQIKYYWARRFFRIFPLYCLYLLAALVSSLLINYIWGPKTWAIPFQLSPMEFIEHILLVAGKGVTWSIAVEFKYYFVLPIVAFVLSVIFKNSVIKGVLFLVSLIAALLVLFPATDFKSMTVELIPYIPVFLFGALLAVLQRVIGANDCEKLPLWLLNILVLVCVGALVLTIPSVYSMVIEPVAFNYFAKSTLMFSVLWSVIIFCFINGNTVFKAIFETRLLCFLGKVSFSLYLMHPIFIDMMRHFKIDTPVNAWIVLFGSILVAIFTYRFIEAPCMNLSKRLVSFKPTKKAEAA